MTHHELIDVALRASPIRAINLGGKLRRACQNLIHERWMNGSRRIVSCVYRHVKASGEPIVGKLAANCKSFLAVVHA